MRIAKPIRLLFVVAGVLAMIAVIGWFREDRTLYEGKRIQVWIQALGVRETRSQAHQVIERAGTAALPALIRHLRATRPSQITREYRQTYSRLWTALPLEGLVPPPRRRDFRRAAVIGLIGKLGPSAESAIPELNQCLADDDPRVRIASANALREIGLGAASASVDNLIRLLLDADPGVRRAAVQTLGRFGESARAAVPELRQLSSDRDQSVRTAVREVLAVLEPSSPKLP